MPYRITITPVARRQLAALTVRERNTLRTAMVDRLQHQPTVPTRAIKRLKPNRTAMFEMRVGDLRVLYDVDGSDVLVKIVGQKAGELLIVDGEVFDGLRDNPPEPPGGEPPDHPG